MKPSALITAVLFGCLFFTPMTFARPVQTIGWIEHVRLHPNNIMLNAKIDTGADNSSIHADRVEIHEEHGVTMVKFAVVNKDGDSAEFDLPLVRYATIKRKGAEPLQRPVVSMGLCVGNTLKTVNINLANRGNFKYRMLIGRSYLKEHYLVDPGKQHTSEPACTGQTLSQREAF